MDTAFLDCAERPSIFYCSTHQTAVCLECVAKHDELGKCIYVPAYRAPKPTAEAVTPERNRPSREAVDLEACSGLIRDASEIRKKVIRLTRYIKPYVPRWSPKTGQ